jgi:hypothetical protein
MRLFYLAYPPDQISETLPRKLPPKIARAKSETLSRTLSLEQLATVFPLSWSHYVHLIRRTRSVEEREFYEGGPLRMVPISHRT